MNAAIFAILLKELHVPYTRWYVQDVFDRLPYGGSLWAIHKALDEYGIANVSYRVTEKDQLTEIPVPFLAKTSAGFVVITDISDDIVIYSTTKSIEKSSTDEFDKVWNGVVMAVDASDAAEPDLENHQRTERLSAVSKCILCVCALFLIVLCVGTAPSGLRASTSVALILNAVGVGLSFLLAKSAMHIESRTADQLCGLFQHGDCNRADKEKLKLFGVWDLSEIGLAYFATNAIALLTFPVAGLTVLPLISVIVLPFSIWSIAYQRVKLKSWCPLCMYTMVLLWVQFAAFAALGDVSIVPLGETLWVSSATIIAGYIVLLTVIHAYIRQYTVFQRAKAERDSLRKLKFDKKNWETLLHSSAHHNTDCGEPIILSAGDESMPQITVVGNPYCNPCAKMHRRLETLSNNDFRINSILTVFHAGQAPAIRQLVGVYHSDPEKISEYFDHWYDKGRFADTDNYFSLSDDALNAAEVESIVEAQYAWMAASGLHATPTILVDGYEMPEGYQIEDLVYLY